jgi:hypothetical protein
LSEPYWRGSQAGGAPVEHRWRLVLLQLLTWQWRRRHVYWLLAAGGCWLLQAAGGCVLLATAAGGWSRLAPCRRF